ncbi:MULTISPECIES: Hint domain-containing protein [unclassified Ruegeria]|uniref:Hint domain-containing protein n=1 Tax=unclassified Ruegeria TaxID=2625375 RepID=UPI001487E5BE|nr:MULTISPECIES: Hint domain-containing protein [unclassified Ruegeria]
MPVFITLTDADTTDPAFWAAQDIGPDSTIDASGLSRSIQVTMTGNSITFTDTRTGTVTTYTDADLAGGSFSQFVEYTGNANDDNISGSVGLNAGGYSGGAGDDTLTDTGSLGGSIRGGQGNDTLQGGSGNNNIFGNAGDDILRGGSGNNILSGGAGSDTLFAEDGSGNLDGGSGADTIHAGLNTTFVTGGSGNDTLILPAGSTFAPFSPGASGGTATLPNGRTFTYVNIENVEIACFTAGTLIRTPEGERPIEELEVGDLVETLDNGAQPVRWIGKRSVDGQGKHAPIRFEPGSIGNRRALCVSPQHRVLVSGWRCELFFHSDEMLCAAKHLCDGETIRQAPCETVNYVHIMFDRHEIVECEGARLESFFAGEHILHANRAVYDELIEIFPELATKKGAPIPARPFLRNAEASLLI